MDKESGTKHERLSTRAIITQILSDAARETTVHGICRLAGQRPIYVKICWLIAFLIFFGIFSNSMYSFTVKLINGEISTSYDAESVDFEFPDVYFCNGVQISGTYSVILPENVVNEFNTRMNSTFAAFDYGLQRLIDTIYFNSTSSQIDMMRLNRLKSVIQSMPYSLLVDHLSHKEQQMIMRNDSKPGATLIPFYHPNHLKCLRVNLSDERRTELSKVNSEISFQFLLDPHFTDFDDSLRVSSYKQVKSVTVPIYNNLTTYVYDWDLDTPFEIDRPMGMRLYLAPRGEYPSRFVTNFLLAPGRSYSIGLTMEIIKKEPDAFKGQCISNAPEVAFVNPYDQSAYQFIYSNSFCYFSEFAKQLAQNGCTPYVNPIPWEYKRLRFCLNLTGLNETDIKSNILQTIRADTSVLNDYQEMCQSKQLCLNRRYVTSISNANWPNENGQVRVITELMKLTMDAAPNISRPSWESAYKIIIQNYIASKYDQMENFANKFFSRSGLKVTLRSQESKSSRIVLSSGYSFPTYIADMGGTAGIYIGCSLLSLCELIELFYDLIVKTRRQPKSRITQVVPIS